MRNKPFQVLKTLICWLNILFSIHLKYRIILPQIGLFIDFCDLRTDIFWSNKWIQFEAFGRRTSGQKATDSLSNLRFLHMWERKISATLNLDIYFYIFPIFSANPISFFYFVLVRSHEIDLLYFNLNVIFVCAIWLAFFIFYFFGQQNELSKSM